MKEHVHTARQTRVRVPNPSREEHEGGFECAHCSRFVPAIAPGTMHRNHCPLCLWSLHVDIRTGDRRSGCRGAMEPIAVWVRPDGEWALIHRCRACGALRPNRIAGDDNELVLVSLALRALARPAFPLESVGAHMG